MDEETQVVKKTTTESTETGPVTGGESKVMNVSVRAWIAITLVVTVCIMSANGILVVEPLYSLSLLAIGFYFGQRDRPKTQI